MSYPDDIRTLTSLRFFAALAVVLHHFFQFYPHQIGTHIFEKGYLAVDLFFILSGFILSHAYQQSLITGKETRQSFLIRRIARIYPIHFFVLLLLFLYWFVQVQFGSLSAERFSIDELLNNLLLLHGWGLPGALSWNGPSWSVSAEWFAYLLFPFLLSLAQCIRTVPVLAFATVLYAMAWAVSYAINPDYPLTTYTNILRIMPSFLLGMALYRWGNSFILPIAEWIAVVSAVSVLLLMHLGAPDILVVYLCGLLIISLAEITRQRSTKWWLVSSFPVFLGQISYSLYMVHYPIIVLVFMPYVGRVELGGVGLASFIMDMLLVCFLCISLSVFLYFFVEMPCRKWIVSYFCFRR